MTPSRLRGLTHAIPLCVALGLTGCTDQGKPKPTHPIAVRAADISFFPEIEEAGTVFKDSNGQAKDLLHILKEAGCNTIRLRLWHTPATVRSGLAEVQHLSSRIRAEGFKLWITIHYSDTWADPGQQTKPSAWGLLPLNDLADSVYNYTFKVVSALNPDFIQVGNEINNGFLWPNGQISNQVQFITLLKRGIQAVRDVNSEIKLMMHFAGMEGAADFFGLLQTNSVDYDIAGLSYYPRWHTRNLDVVKETLNELASQYNKPIILAEVGYPFTLGWYDQTNNLVGLEEHLVDGYPATVTGQRNFLLKLRQIVSETEGGLGLAYWAPEWVAFKGAAATDGSAWENMTLFDFNIRALGGLDVFKE